MAILQVIIITILAEAVAYSVFKAWTPSAQVKDWVTLCLYVLIFVLTQTGIFALVGAKMYGYADYTLTGVMCSVGVDGVKQIVANIMEQKKQEGTSDGGTK